MSTCDTSVGNFLSHRWFLLFLLVYVGATSVSSPLQLPTLLSSYDQFCFPFLTHFYLCPWLFAPPVWVSCNWHIIPNPISVSDVIPIFCSLHTQIHFLSPGVPPDLTSKYPFFSLPFSLRLISRFLFHFSIFSLDFHKSFPVLSYCQFCCHLFSLFFIISNFILFQITFAFICPNSQYFHSVFPNLFPVHMFFPQETYDQPASISYMFFDQLLSAFQQPLLYFHTEYCLHFSIVCLVSDQ